MPTYDKVFGGQLSKDFDYIFLIVNAIHKKLSKTEILFESWNSVIFVAKLDFIYT